jgi:hypothetical protein
MAKPTYRIIVAGGREFLDYELATQEITDLLIRLPDGVFFDGNDGHIQFVLGGARGADSLAEKFADEYGFDKKMFIPEWTRPDGSKDRGAGIKRNHEMGNYGTHLIAFWDGRSPGTKDMINYATKKGLEVKVVRY